MKHTFLKNLYVLTAVAAVFVAIVLFAAPAFADFTPIVQCGLGKDPCTICDIPITISRLINYVVYVIATPLAIFMVIVGGFMMLTAGPSPQRYETGKKALINTLIGISFVYFSWIIVNTILLILVGAFGGGGSGRTGGFKGVNGFINWNSLPGVGKNCPLGGGASSVSLSSSPPPSSPPPLSPSPSQPPPPTSGNYNNQEAAQRFVGAGIDIRSSGNCSSRNNSACTSFDGIPISAIDALLALQKDLEKTCPSCRFTVVGGTEVGHSTHGVGKSIMDLSSKDARVNQFIKNQIGNQNPNLNIWYKGGANQYYFYEGDHWHVCLNTANCPKAVGKD